MQNSMKTCRNESDEWSSEKCLETKLHFEAVQPNFCKILIYFTRGKRSCWVAILHG